jgi:hypothetical protein
LAELNDNEIIEEQVGKILASGVLGRSRFYVALLQYLLECSRRDHAPKEIEIAADVFNRGQDFDPSQDSMVRVYAHNLRQKLQQYYTDHAEAGTRRIAIPKGEYRIAVVAADDGETVAAPPPAAAPGRLANVGTPVVVAMSLIAGLLLGLYVVDEGAPTSASAGVADSVLWAAMTDDELPITLAVGDYYIFGELDDYGNIGGMRREFDINSSRDLDERFMLDPEAAERYLDLELTYLPTSTAFALRDLMQVLATTGKEIRVVAMSNLETSTLRQSHIVYLGYLSALGMLSDFVFDDSDLAIGDTFDELVHLTSGEVFISEAGLPSGPGSYVDYGLFSTFPGPNGNQFVIVAGMRDEGLMQTAQAVSSPAMVSDSIAKLISDDAELPPAFELLYEVAGLDRMNLNARIVHAAALDR